MTALPPPFRFDPRQRAFVEAHRVARLATADPSGRPHLVPVVFALVGDEIYVPLDQKPKRVPARALRRVRNILANPRVALLVDDYSEDWQDLAYVLIRGAAILVEPGNPEHAAAIAALRRKYAQYADMPIEQNPVIRVRPERVHAWSTTARAE